jgi:predicted ATPase
VTDFAIRDNSRLQQDGEMVSEGFTPMVCIREKGVSDWIPYSEMSSGMQKVLLILTDLETLPEGTVYLLDEYENSLGVNAINFLPDYLAQVDTTFQMFITSHHPYLINRVDPRHWYVFSRNGPTVQIREGTENARLYGASSQDAFMQLINDPFYSGNVG